MPDKLVRHPSDQSIIQRFVDMGDGTFAPRSASAQAPITSGGLLLRKVQAAATTNATLVKAAAGQVYGMEFTNVSATTAFVKLYNSAVIPTAGVGVPVWVVAIPPGGSREINRPAGVAFSAGIGYTITRLVADADVTPTTADDITGSINYF